MANILIIDDNQSLRLAYSTFLKQAGHQITAASSVDEALAYLATNTPDLILLDMLLPKKNGLELLQQYDVLNTHKEVKVIAFTNLTETRIEQEATTLGVQGYLNKSTMTPTALVDTIRKTLAS